MRWTAIAIVSVIALGTATTYAQPALQSGTENVEKFGWVLKLSKWDRMPIDVCWEDLEGSSATDRWLVRQAVHTTWEAHSKVRFVGWDTQCTSNSPGIRIAVRDDVAQVRALGNYLDKMPRGMILNFTMTKWKPPCKGTRSQCITAVATHEFGHALGFSHEQNRPDKPDLCREPKQGADGDFTLTEYDEKSIMNYCNAGWTGLGGLSDRDKAALRSFYGAV